MPKQMFLFDRLYLLELIIRAFVLILVCQTVYDTYTRTRGV